MGLLFSRIYVRCVGGLRVWSDRHRCASKTAGFTNTMKCPGGFEEL
jgi:hypothetical protein